MTCKLAATEDFMVKIILGAVQSTLLRNNGGDWVTLFGKNLFSKPNLH